MKAANVKKFICGAYLCILTVPFFAQDINPRLIIRSDDMGAFHSVNTACMETYTNGITTSIEVMPVASWFPEAVKLLQKNPGVDVGVHLAITSEWENMKWRPLTNCPSLVDKNGYFFPVMAPNEAYKGQSVMENNWNLSEIEQEYRAQIELALKNIPQISHLSGHMGSLRFNEEVSAMVLRLADEYNLTIIDHEETAEKYNVHFVGYDGSNQTTEKESSFIKMLNSLQGGKNYMFIDHPALDTDEMKAVGHIGYEWVAEDRQGVTNLLVSENVMQTIKDRNIELVSYNDVTKSLPRGEASKKMKQALANYLLAVNEAQQDLHSIMVIQQGKVIAEKWMSEGAPNKLHVLNSVSKTFTATAIGFAVTEGRIKVTDKVISFFPDKLPATVNDNLKEMEIRHLLTMSTGQDKEPSRNSDENDWVDSFFSTPAVYNPGSEFMYNSMATYMLSAIIQQVTGEKLIDYLYPRLFRPLGIVGATWDESPQGINTGGWGLYVKTEDMAKLGQFFLQKGKWNGKQLLPETWIEEATTSKIASLPAGTKREDLKMKPEDSDWLQGYGYQMWRGRHNSYRADGAQGQYIIIIPEKNAVIVTTANIRDMQAEMNLIWKYLLPAL